MYTENELVGIAKRENNKKRNYLVVNKLQGKHVPVSPSAIMAQFEKLARMVKGCYAKESLLCIGFAETATAIGACVAAALPCYYMQTTRERVEGAEYLFFSEAHSHATEQKLVKEDLDRMIGERRIDRILFIEDEVTTGNTILNIIEVIKKHYHAPLSYSVASLLNGMDKEAQKRFEERGIALHYLLKTDHSCYERKAETYKGDGEYSGLLLPESPIPFIYEEFHDYFNARKAVKSKEYQEAVDALGDKIVTAGRMEKGSKALVLGTEEFMYPALIAALKMEENGCEVRFHATTRSPIMVSGEEDYPLHKRYELRSLYEKERTTYLYDLSKYDEVFIITDAQPAEQTGLNSLLCPLYALGNKKIHVIRWCAD